MIKHIWKNLSFFVQVNNLKRAKWQQHNITVNIHRIIMIFMVPIIATVNNTIIIQTHMEIQR